MISPKSVLMITRPIAPPWNESSKNLTYGLALHSKRYKTHLMTVKEQEIFMSEHMTEERIYARDSSMLGNLPLIQKLRVLSRLIKFDRSIDIYHFIMAPKYYQSQLFKLIANFKGKKTVQSIICLITGKEDNHNLFFADEIVVFSRFTKQKVERLTNSNITRIDPGIDLSKFKVVENNQEIKKQFLIDNKKVVLYCGDYALDQGAWKVLRAVPMLVQQVPNALVIFACRGKNKEHLLEQQLLKQHVIDLGLNNEVLVLENEWRIDSLISACDVAILPADRILRKLDYPLILLECLAMGKPIVISDIPPLNEIMRDEIGILLKNNSEQEIIEALCELLSDKEKCLSLGRAGRALVERDFRIEQMSEKYERIYDRVLHGN